MDEAISLGKTQTGCDKQLSECGIALSIAPTEGEILSSVGQASPQTNVAKKHIGIHRQELHIMVVRPTFKSRVLLHRGTMVPIHVSGFSIGKRENLYISFSVCPLIEFVQSSNCTIPGSSAERCRNGMVQYCG